jgi:phosphoserine/homoserine phosphotransferase
MIQERLMKLACIDLEGVLVPELWPIIAERTGIDSLALTTREVPDYNLLMRNRIALLRENGLRLSCVSRILSDVEPVPGARQFFDELAFNEYEINIISDCFIELANPLLDLLGGPPAMCHRLHVDRFGFVTNCSFYKRAGKEDHVAQALSEKRYVLAVGDAFNAMLRMANKSYLVSPSAATRAAAPDIKTVASIDEIITLLVHERAALE